ncbi:MAG: hypothetical protein HS106_04610 [Ideonella sp.]|nr:MAG: hypothetical protein F9K36_06630 [Burkholderiaceae bacterium]MBE7425319.1 hypothetical protein [Ideonella sp.]
MVLDTPCDLRTHAHGRCLIAGESRRVSVASRDSFSMLCALLTAALLSIPPATRGNTGFPDIDDKDKKAWEVWQKAPPQSKANKPRPGGEQTAPRQQPGTTVFEQLTYEQLVRACTDRRLAVEQRKACHDEVTRRLPARARQSLEEAEDHFAYWAPKNEDFCGEFALRNGVDDTNRAQIKTACLRHLGRYRGCIEQVGRSGLVPTPERYLRCYRGEPVAAGVGTDPTPPAASDSGRSDGPGAPDAADPKREYEAKLRELEDDFARRDRDQHDRALALSRELQALAGELIDKRREQAALTDRLSRLEHELNYGSSLSIEALQRDIERLRNEQAQRQIELDRLEAAEHARRLQAQELQQRQEQTQRERADALEAFGRAFSGALQRYSNKSYGATPPAIPSRPGASPRHPCYDSSNPPRYIGGAGCPGSGGNPAPGQGGQRYRDDTAPSRPGR